MLVLFVLFSVAFNGSDNLLQRHLFDLAQRHATPTTSNDVVVIAIDENTKTRLGAGPWPSAVHAALIERLHAGGVKAIGFAMPLQGADDEESLNRARQALGNHAGDIDAGQLIRLRDALDLGPRGAERLDEVMRAEGHVVLSVDVSTRPGTGEALPQGLLAMPTAQFNEVVSAASAPAARVVSVDDPKLLQAAAAVAHVAQPVDRDGTVRREQTLLQIDAQLMPALSVALTTQARGSDAVRMQDAVLQDGQRELKLRDDLSLRLNTFALGNALAAAGPSYWQVLTGTVPASSLQGRIAIIGFTEGVNADRIATPLGTQPRVAVVAAATTGLLNGMAYQHPLFVTLLMGLLAVMLAALVALLFPMLSAGWNLAVAGGLGLALLLTDFLVMRAGGPALETLPIVTALLGVALLSALLRKWVKSPAKSKTTRPQPNLSMDTLKTLALTLHGQGQLDLAFETLRRCPGNSETLDLLYRLGNDFERRQQTTKAAQVFRYIAEQDRGFKDAAARSKQASHSSASTAAPPLSPRSEKPALRPNGPAFKAADIAKPAARNTAAPEPEFSPRPGKEMLGRYEIEKQIGKGAMGVVYLGRDPKINRVVAIKAIPLAQEFDDEDLDEARERFFREAEMAGRLNHPGIVTIHDAGEDRGLAYIAMEYLHGEHLSYYTDSKRLLPIPKALTLILRVAEALAYAHRQNVVHRDIKPANIMLNIDNDMLKITDFGIARLADVSRTKTGIVLGTPSFMSPEQLEGRPLDGRSDLFALGVTMYQLLSGQLPFRADSMTRLMNNIALEPHPPIRSLRPELPACVETIVDRALAKDAADRYQTGSEMAEAIRSCLRTIKP